MKVVSAKVIDQHGHVQMQHSRMSNASNDSSPGHHLCQQVAAPHGELNNL